MEKNRPEVKGFVARHHQSIDGRGEIRDVPLMRAIYSAVFASLSLIAAGCEATSSGGSTSGNSSSSSSGSGAGGQGTGGQGTGGQGTGGQGTAGQGTGGMGMGGMGGGGGAGGGAVVVTSEQLLSRVQSCVQIAGTQKFATDSGGAKTIPVCQLNGAVWWTSDMDIDCDGGQGAICMNDPWYLPDTSATDSNGNPLDASTLPFFVIPLPSNGFDYAAHGIGLGSVAAVIYAGKIEYAIFGDQGPKGIIGEGSFALAEKLGIDSDPAIGGVDSGVTFIVFTGVDAKVSKNEDHNEAIAIGKQRAAKFLVDN
jgi:hypothetical protein